MPINILWKCKTLKKRKNHVKNAKQKISTSLPFSTGLWVGHMASGNRWALVLSEFLEGG